MKFGFAVIGLLATCATMPTMAATLKLSPEINLLVIDGKKVSSSLFKGSTGLELVDGQHQILFRVEKPVRYGSRDEDMYSSDPLIANFDSANSDIITISLPRITTKAEAARFDKNPSFTLVNEKGQTINAVKDKLKLEGLVIAADMEMEMAKYNTGNGVAAIPSLAQITVINPRGYPQTSMPPVPVTRTPVAQNSVTVKGETAEEEMLQYWFQRADKETRKRFLDWANKNSGK
jgi:uncharacterized protein YccT (UPF0319 family)